MSCSLQTLAAKRGKSGLKTTTIPSNTVKDEELVSLDIVLSFAAICLSRAFCHSF